MFQTFWQLYYFARNQIVSGIGAEVDAFVPHISQWHGVNLPLILSIVVIIIGLILALVVNWKEVTHQIIKELRLQMAIGKFIEI